MPENGSAADSEFRWDAGSFFSSVMGFGNLTKDKLETFHVGARPQLSPVELFTLYEQNNFIGNAIDAVPDAACQEYCKYESGSDGDDDSDDSEQNESDDSSDDDIQKELNKARPHINQAWKLARLQGWAAVLLLIDDGVRDYSQPVDTNNIRGISGYKALSGGASGQISVMEWDEDPFSVTYSEPILFTIANANTIVHASRVLLFYGVKKLSRFQAGTQGGQLGTSIINRCYQEFRNFDVGNNSIAATLPDFNLDIFEIPGLAQLMAKQKDFAEYMSGMAFARSVLKVMLVEAGQDGQNQGGYKVVARQYVGIKDVLEFFKQLFAGSVDIPNVLLFNESPSGTTSGKFESRSWAQYIGKQQQSELDPELRKLVGYIHSSKGGEPSSWTLTYPSILELDENEMADIELKQAQRLQLLVSSMIVAPEEAAKALAEGVDVGQAIDLKAREEERQSLTATPEGMVNIAGMASAAGGTAKNQPQGESSGSDD